MASPPHASCIEVRLNDTRSRDELGVASDRPCDPVDVRRLERGDVPERVPVELAELDDVRPRPIESRRAGPPEVPDPGALERPGRSRRSRRLLTDALTTERRMAAQWRAAAMRVLPTGLARGRLVTGLERRGRIDPSGDGPRRPGRRWPATTTRAVLPEVGRRAARRSFAVRLAGKRGIRVVDLGHLPGGDPRRGGVVAGQVGVVRPRESPPRGLDAGRIGAPLDAEDLVGIAFRHGRSVPAGSCRVGA
jgi:hypothetical protein